MVNKDDEYY